MKDGVLEVEGDKRDGNFLKRRSDAERASVKIRRKRGEVRRRTKEGKVSNSRYV